MSSKTTASGATTVQTPENENSLVTSIALFAVMMALFLGAIPQTILGRSDSAGEH
jgi:hypothetical protein